MLFRSYSVYCRAQFGMRAQKIPLDGGFGCPNRDGTLGREGCSFCNNRAFSPAYGQSAGSLSAQIEAGIRFCQGKYRGRCCYLAYLQSYSNTYAPLPMLRQRYEELLAHPQISGLVIATRPDCIDEEKLDYIASLAEKYYVAIEYGIESCSDAALRLVGRGHDYACSCRAIEQTARRGIRCGGHLILGLPGEDRSQMAASASLLSQLPLSALKLHQLQLLKGSAFELRWRQHPASIPPPFSVDEYVVLVCDFLERLRPDIVIERLAAEVPPRYQADPARSWHHPDGAPVRHSELARMVESELARRGSCQGSAVGVKTQNTDYFG